MTTEEWILPKSLAPRGSTPISSNATPLRKHESEEEKEKSDCCQVEGLQPEEGLQPVEVLQPVKGRNPTIPKVRSELEAVQPIPWPMPPRRGEDGTLSRESESRLHMRDGEAFLTPKASFEEGEMSNKASKAVFTTVRKLYPDDSLNVSRASSKGTSFSSGVSVLSFRSAGPSLSTQSSGNVEPDREEAPRIHSEKTSSSESVVDFLTLFGEEDGKDNVSLPGICDARTPEEIYHALSDSFLSKPKSRASASKQPFSSTGHTGRSHARNIRIINRESGTAGKGEAKKSKSSRTPKKVGSDCNPETRRPFTPEPPAYRVEFRSPRAQRLGINNQTFVNLKELRLRSSPAFKGISGMAPSPNSEEIRDSSDRTPNAVRALDFEETTASSAPKPNPPVLRRPIASRRKTFVGIPRHPNPFHETSITRSGEITKDDDTERNRSGLEAKSNGKPPQQDAKRPRLPKGVIVRPYSRAGQQVAGIRRAETGKIMSRDELRAQKSLGVQESPNPKSLNPAAFLNDKEDEAGTRSTMFGRETESESDSDDARDAKFVCQLAPVAVDDGSFLTPSLQARRTKASVDSYKVDSLQFSEHDDSSGLLNRLSFGFKKAASAVTKRSSGDVSEAPKTDIILLGTIDEAVCKICVVCRKQLNCNVFVKDTGRKIKVESRDDSKGRYLRASLIVRRLPGHQTACAVNIRQSRSDGMRTSFATLWDFYQRLESGLNEMS